MKRVKEKIDTEKKNEYLNIRLQQYEEKTKKGMTAEQKSEFYSNIMEIVSLNVSEVPEYKRLWIIHTAV